MQNPPYPPAATKEFVPPRTEAGHPFLAFLNTVLDDGKTRHQDSFDTGEALMAQLQAAGFEINVEAPGQGQLEALRTLREAAYGVLSAIAGDRGPQHEDVLGIELAIKSALSDARITVTRGRPRWEPGPLGGLPDALALSLADLLQSDELGRLKECKRCTHLFLDHGRGPGRRWCSMARCGNRAKAQGFRDRQKARS